VGILDAMLGRREPAVEYRTIDGGHPAPYPDMTDEQLYNYELAFNVPNKTFDRPPRSRAAAQEPTLEPGLGPGIEPVVEPLAEPVRPGTGRYRASAQSEKSPRASRDDEEGARQPETEDWEHLRPQNRIAPPDAGPPLDFSRPIRTVTTKHPVEIITTRARHPVYKVHGYIGDDDVVTVFTLDGRLSENGPRFIENVPQKEQLFLNVYPHPDAHSKERFLLTQHPSRAEADALAGAGRIACVPVEFDIS
jgi:hypothetical protein